MLRHTKNFPEWVFEHFKSEGYILNTKSWSRIYFRTLDNDAQNILWLTVKTIIVDEAQLVSTYVFEEVLEPTISTTNGRMILIWTPWRTAKWYYYELIMEAKKSIETSWIKIAVKSEDNPDVSYYQIDITQNPLIAPRLRAKVMKNKDKPSNQRQYFCNWNSWEDQLFKPTEIEWCPILSDDWYFVITFDPARKWRDRSAFCVTYTYNWKIYIILSWFVPKALKAQWTKQIWYYSKWLMKNFWKFKNLSTWVDLRWIWEWFTEAWENHFKSPNPNHALIKITYTTWEVKKVKWLEWQISKTLLISNWQDTIDEWLVYIVKWTNKDLSEELQFLYEDEDNKKRLAMKSTFLDDISNALLCNLYIIQTRNYIKRSFIVNKDWQENIDDRNEVFKSKKARKKKRINSTW